MTRQQLDKKNNANLKSVFFKTTVFKVLKAKNYLLKSQYRFLFSSLRTNETCLFLGVLIGRKRQSKDHS